MKSNGSMLFIIVAIIKSSVKEKKKEIYLFCHATSLNVCIF